MDSYSQNVGIVSHLKSKESPARQEFELVTFRDERERGSREASWVKVAQKSFPIDGEQAAKNTRPFLDSEYNLLTTMSNFGPLRQKLLQDLLLRKNADNKDPNTTWIIDFVFPGKDEIERGKRRPPRSFWVVLRRLRKEPLTKDGDEDLKNKKLRRHKTTSSQNTSLPQYQTTFGVSEHAGHGNPPQYQPYIYAEASPNDRGLYHDHDLEHGYSTQEKQSQHDGSKVAYAPPVYQEPLSRGRSVSLGGPEQGHYPRQPLNVMNVYNPPPNTSFNYGTNNTNSNTPSNLTSGDNAQMHDPHHAYDNGYTNINMSSNIGGSRPSTHNNTPLQEDSKLHNARRGREMFQEYPSPNLLRKSQSYRTFERSRSGRDYSQPPSRRYRSRQLSDDYSDFGENYDGNDQHYHRGQGSQYVDHEETQHRLRKKSNRINAWVQSGSTESSDDGMDMPLPTRMGRSHSRPPEREHERVTLGRSSSRPTKPIMLPRRSTTPSASKYMPTPPPPMPHLKRTSRSRLRKYAPSDDEDSKDSTMTPSDEELTQVTEAIGDFRMEHGRGYGHASGNGNGLHQSRSFRNVRFG